MVKIEKEQKPIIAYTRYYKIEGKIYTPIGARLSDFISGVGQKKFIPVTDAIVTDMLGNGVCKTSFLELNKDEIVFIIPESELKTK